MPKVERLGNEAVRLPILSLHLRREVQDTEVGAWQMHRVGLVSEGFDQNLTYKKPQSADSCLSPEAWKFLQDYLPARPHPSIFSSRDAHLSIGSLVMKNLSIVCHEVSGGVQKLMLSFLNVLGSPSQLFQPMSAPSFLNEFECNLSTKALQDILLPVMNLLGAPSNGNTQETASQGQLQLEMLQNKQHELAFYTSMLTRYVCSAEARMKSANPAEMPRPMDEFGWPHEIPMKHIAAG